MIHVQDYTIETDVSLLPFAQTKIDEGVIIPELFQTIPYEVTGEIYSSFYFLKSSSKTTYSRAFNKIDQFFSYVGGLIGTILGVMLFMGNFAFMSFELDISQRIFKYREEDHSNF